MEGRNAHIAQGWMDFMRTAKPQAGLDHGAHLVSPASAPSELIVSDAQTEADALEEFKQLIRKHPALSRTQGEPK